MGKKHAWHWPKWLMPKPEPEHRTDQEKHFADDEFTRRCKCGLCGSRLNLVVTPKDQPYQSWMVCKNPACRHQTLLRS